jgi:hypothetical protein
MAFISPRNHDYSILINIDIPKNICIRHIIVAHYSPVDVHPNMLFHKTTLLLCTYSCTYYGLHVIQGHCHAMSVISWVHHCCGKFCILKTTRDTPLSFLMVSKESLWSTMLQSKAMEICMPLWRHLPYHSTSGRWYIVSYRNTPLQTVGGVLMIGIVGVTFINQTYPPQSCIRDHWASFLDKIQRLWNAAWNLLCIDE